MVIDSLKIQGFRALYDAVLQPGSFTVLAGANNAGKTTLADALDFLADVHRYRLEVALSRKGGFENVAFRRMRRTRRPVRLEVKVALEPRELSTLTRHTSRRPRQLAPNGQVIVTHSFAFKPTSSAIAADYSVTSEELVIEFRDADTDEDIRVATIVRDEQGINSTALGVEDTPEVMRLFTDITEQLTLWKDRGTDLDDTVLLVEVFPFHPVLRLFTRALAAMRIYQISPLESRRPGVPTPNPALERYGENLPALVDFFRKRDKNAWHQVFSAMQEIVPNLTDIVTDFSTDRRLVLQFKERGVGRPWNANEISDGTIQSLALFCALFDPRTSLVFIEEPENSVHPWIVRVFADACRTAAANGKQIFVTTHSPALLEYAKPTEVKLIWREEGRAKIAPLLQLGPEVKDLWESGAVDVFEFLDSGAIREAVPEGSK